MYIFGFVYIIFLINLHLYLNQILIKIYYNIMHFMVYYIYTMSSYLMEVEIMDLKQFLMNFISYVEVFFIKLGNLVIGMDLY